MIGVDTNILVYAHRRDAPWHAAAAAGIAALAQGAAPWTIPWPCIHEFYAVVTHPRVFKPPSTPAEAIRQIELWRESPSLVLAGESEDHWVTLRGLIVRARLTGPAVHDARIAAICADHGVHELWTADRDFSRFPGLTVVNPLLDTQDG